MRSELLIFWAPVGAGKDSQEPRVLSGVCAPPCASGACILTGSLLDGSANLCLATWPLPLRTPTVNVLRPAAGQPLGIAAARAGLNNSIGYSLQIVNGLIHNAA